MLMTANEFNYALRVLGISQAALARWLDLNVTTVNRYSRGKQEIPKTVERVLSLTKLNLDVMSDIDGDGANPLTEENPFRLDDFDILGVDPDVPLEVIHKKYIRLMKQHHPDLGGSPEKAATISAAYDSIVEQLSNNTVSEEEYAPGL